jgi:cytidylate kinase
VLNKYSTPAVCSASEEHGARRSAAALIAAQALRPKMGEQQQAHMQDSSTTAGDRACQTAVLPDAQLLSWLTHCAGLCLEAVVVELR